ncbi:MAG: uroporphyrinogen-III synthase [Woeseia sp.]|nr:uroporphyrinogen-III synthase [Woeseia sp.]MBT8096445.1 uroporphyrinogen-III synthase [Woeseia sp.]NNE59892.1 uroporphyrinogen-III synthase [Woeseia sp.]NNL53701.1 uroporphyrinogen-III synthase [Woeseia sp.]
MTDREDEKFSVLLTRPRQQAGPLAAAIEAANGHVVPFPVMAIEPRNAAEIAAKLATLPPADVVIFVSPNAVQHGLAALAGAARIGAIGSATAAALKAAGHAADIFPKSGFTSEALLQEQDLQEVAGKRIRIVRGDGGRELLAATLKSRGATVDYLTAYRRRRYSATSAELVELESLWRTRPVDYVIVMSIESLEFLLELLPGWCRQALGAAALVTPSARVLKTAQESIPDTRTLLADSPDSKDLVAAMLADQQALTDKSHE